MTNEQQRDPKFYVVGGAVQPGRDCYLQRMADAELYRRVSENEYCHVLAQPQAGKTSLAASTAARLRIQETGVAVVDLDRISDEDLSENAGRWYYSIAYRIARDLRIKSDLQSWWAERGGLTNLQRLREFFQEIVLQETEQPVVVFFDRLEVTCKEPLAQDLFAAIRACYDARATATDFNRLTFVMLASAAAEELVGKLQGSPFEISTAIELRDFSPQELSGLVNGLGELQTDPEAIIARVWSWTQGHPYLSQKVFRGLARRSDENISVAEVDALVRLQFTAPLILVNEPHMSAIAERLLRDDSGRTQRLNLYGRVRKGVEVSFDPSSGAQHELLMTGIVTINPDGELCVRNEIYATVFSTRWVNQNLPFGGRGIVAAAVVLALLIALPVWYTEYLPRPYIRSLNTVNQDFQVAEDAYHSLNRLPGYAATADRLYSDFLTRTSRGATSLADIMRINSRLKLMPGGDQRGVSLLAEYWQRQAVRLMHEGDRDGALVAVLEALREPTERRRRLAAELIGADYRRLWATLHSRAPLSEVRADPLNNLISILDQQNHVDIWRLGAQRPEYVRGLRLVAEERLQIEQRRAYTKFPTQPRLIIKLSNVQKSQVQVVLRAPGGQGAVLKLDQATRLRDSLFAFDFNDFVQLRQLLSGELAGTWTLLLSDLERGAEGELLGWDITSRSASSLADEQAQPQPVPTPRTSVNAISLLSDDGRLAATWPANPDTVGPLLVWDLLENTVLSRIARGADMRAARFAMQGKRILIVRAQTVEIWDSISGRKLGQFAPSTPGQPRLQLSANGRFAALSVQQGDNKKGVAVWDLAGPSRVAVISADATVTAVDSAGRFLATGGRDAWARIWSLSDGSLLREFATGAPLRSLGFDAQGKWLVADDLSHIIRLWSVADDDEPTVERVGSSPWFSAFATDSRRIIVGSPHRSYQVFELPEGRKAGPGLRHGAPARLRPDSVQGPLLFAGLNLALTAAGGNNIKLWQMPDELTAGVPVRTLPAEMVTALSRDGGLIAAGSSIADLRIYVAGAPGGMKLESPAGEPPVRLLSLVFSPDRTSLAAGTIDGKVSVWDAQRAVLRATRIEHPDGPVQDVLFDNTGQLLFSASRREVQVTDLQTGETLARLGIQAEDPRLALAPLSGELFIAGDESGVTRWKWQSGLSDMLIDGDRDIVRAAVTASGRRLITASRSGQLTAWNVDRRLALEQAAQISARVDNMWLVDDGRRLIVQAGHWMHALALQPAGLTFRSTRLLRDAPTTAQPDETGRIISVLSPSASRSRLQRIAIAEPPAGQFTGDPAAARERWHRLLSMSLNSTGQAVPVLPDEAATGY